MMKIYKIVLTFWLFGVFLYGSQEQLLEAKNSVVRILADFRGGSALGTAFAISEKGHFLTNAHVVCDMGNNGRNALRLTAHIKENGINKKYAVKMIWKSMDADLAVIRILSTGIKPLKFANSIIQQDKVTAIGFPTTGVYGAYDTVDDEDFTEASLSSGVIARIISKPLATSEVIKVIQTDAAVNHGNSGGPLVNECGQVVGINESKALDGGKGASHGDVIQGINFAVHRDVATRLLEDEGTPFSIASSGCQLAVDKKFDMVLYYILFAFLMALALFWIILKKKTPTDTMLSRLVNKKIVAKQANTPSAHNTVLRPVNPGLSSIEIGNRMLTVGRSRSCDIVLISTQVSSKHLSLEVRNGVVYVNDLSSTNGTYIDGTKLIANQEQPLYANQKLIIGSEEVVYMVS